ncbi:hypothetical protein H8D83_01445 [Candidatus Woesearchaeota archaeon]|nr:hypothetical protein [Candidatus Woesearchaeota archaeon]MBL7050816.1 hypothetical protein [Candidatus Woesearchaeota archaeon]
MVIKNKKAGFLTSKLGKIIIVLVVIVIIMSIFFPKIWSGLGTAMQLVGIDICPDTRMSSTTYNQEIERHMDYEEIEGATELYLEYRQCFSDPELTLNEENTKILAEHICKKGYFNYSSELYNYLSSENPSETETTCLTLENIQYLHNKRKNKDALKLLEQLQIPDYDVPSWNLLRAEVYLASEEYEDAYNSAYYNSWELDLTTDQKEQIKDIVEKVYTGIIAEKIVDIYDDSDLFCINQATDFQYTTISTNKLSDKIREKGKNIAIKVDSDYLETGENLDGYYTITSDSTKIIIESRGASSCNEIMYYAS